MGRTERITFSADADLIDAARKRALADQTTLDEQFRIWLESYACQKQIAEKALATIRELQRKLNTGGRKFSRDEMNER